MSLSEPAPLVAAPGVPVPDAGTAEWITAADGRRIRAALFPLQGARGSVVISTGRTEPLEKYFEVVDDFRARGFAVLLHDWRGQGLSDRLLKDRRRGHAEGAAPFLSDFNAVLTTYESRLPRPWIALGHSMGGGLMALALARGERRFAGVVLSAPMMGIYLAGQPQKRLATLTGLAMRLGMARVRVPGRADPLALPLVHNMLTHDGERWGQYARQVAACPDLRLAGPTWGWISFALALTSELARPGVAEAIETPVLVALAGEERLVDNIAARAFVARLPKVELLELPQSRHEILREIDPIRDRFYAAFDRWVAAVLAA